MTATTLHCNRQHCPTPCFPCWPQVEVWRSHFIVCEWTPDRPNGFIWAQAVDGSSSGANGRQQLYAAPADARIERFFITSRGEAVLLQERLGEAGDAVGLQTCVLPFEDASDGAISGAQAAAAGAAAAIAGVPPFFRLQRAAWVDAQRGLALDFSGLATPLCVTTHAVDVNAVPAPETGQRHSARPEYAESASSRTAAPSVPPSHGAAHAPAPPASAPQPHAHVCRFNGHSYQLMRTHAKSTCGARVPVTLARRTDLTPGAPGPALLHVYGAYGARDALYFDAAKVALMDEGWVVAVAHVRGGGELGAAWHAAGSGGAKSAGANDALAAAEHLIKSG